MKANESVDALYVSVVTFEKKLRAAHGQKLGVLIPSTKAAQYVERAIQLIGAETPEEKLAYIKLIDEIMFDLSPAKAILGFHKHWPPHALNEVQAKAFTDAGFASIADIVNDGLKHQLGGRASLPNKFKF